MTAVSDACTRGFMHLDLLTERATKLEASESTNKLDAQLCIVPDVSFNCDGRLTSVFLGATINAASISKGSDVLYPEIQIWRLNSMNSTRQDSQQIRLNPGDFSREGVLKYNLDLPMPFQSGDVLGVYQPPRSSSAVTVFYHDNDDVAMSRICCTTVSQISNPPSMLPGTVRQSFNAMNGKQLLISPETGKK